MKLFFAKWKTAVCFAMTTILALMGAFTCFGLNTWQFCHAAGGVFPFEACYLNITCSTKSIMLEGDFEATMKPTGVEIYRAKVKLNGKKGKFKKIGVCKEFTKEQEAEYAYSVWRFTYKDSTVKTGNSYAYKYKAYCGTAGGIHQYQECYSKIKKGMAAKTVGAYVCTVVDNTTKKLVVKLTGKSKKIGFLESQRPPELTLGHNDAELRYKNDGENETKVLLDLTKYSYDGKKWYTKGNFAIKGKQSVYLYFKERIDSDWQTVHNIKVSEYQYAQMFFYWVNYNLQGKIADRYASPQIRFNLSSGTAAVGNFTAMDKGLETFVWEGDIFIREYECD